MSYKNTQVKICGIKTPEALNAALSAGADFIGFVFYPPSPRYIEPETARTLVWHAINTPDLRARLKYVALTVNPTDIELNNLIRGGDDSNRFDMIQLHGDEPPQRVAKIKETFGLPVIKAIRISDKNDLKDVAEYEAAADWLLFDNAHGGSGQCFDWSILEGKRFKKPWMLSGGLTQENVSDAVALLHPDAVDVSSGVEIRRGIKNSEKIKNFINEAKSND